jgi:hypothetical protein
MSHEEIGGMPGTDLGGAAAPTTPEQIMLQEEQLASLDPELAQEISQQEQSAEEAIAQDPSQKQEIEAEFERTAIGEIDQVDPALARELAAEATTVPAPASPTPTPEPTPTPTEPQAQPAPSAQAVTQQEQQLAQQDPQLIQQVEQQANQANQQAIQDPQQAAQIVEQSEAQQIQEVAKVDPKLAEELQAQFQGQDLTMNAQGEPEQGVAPTNQVIGNPNQDASQWSWQGANGYCGPNSISMMIEAAGGQQLTEQQVSSWAIEHGDMTRLPKADDPSSIPSLHYGMLPEQAAQAITQLGEQYGITAEVKQGNMGDLEGYLKQGREVMIEVDAQRLWHEPGQSDPGQADHYVVVTGFDPSTDTVYINDPGVQYGKEEAVPLSEFKSAWSTSDDVMIVTSRSGEGSGGEEEQPGPVLLPIRMDASLVRPA